MKKNKRIPDILQLIKAHQDEIRELVSLQMRIAALTMVYGLFQQEAASLCGAPFQHEKDALCHIEGGEKGSVIVQGAGGS